MEERSDTPTGGDQTGAILVRKLQCLREPSNGVRVRRPPRAALQIGHAAQAQSCPLARVAWLMPVASLCWRSRIPKVARRFPSTLMLAAAQIVPILDEELRAGVRGQCA